MTELEQANRWRSDAERKLIEANDEIASLRRHLAHAWDTHDRLKRDWGLLLEEQTAEIGRLQAEVLDYWQQHPPIFCEECLKEPAWLEDDSANTFWTCGACRNELVTKAKEGRI